METSREEGRKKGAFSGGLGGSVGLFRAAMVSRWRSVCQRLRGTRLRVVRSVLSWSTVGARLSGRSVVGSAEDGFSKAAVRRPSLPSPEAVGRAVVAISSSRMWRVGTWVNRARLVQMLMPTLSV